MSAHKRMKKPTAPAAAPAHTPKKRSAAGAGAAQDAQQTPAKKPKKHSWGVPFMLFRLLTPMYLAAQRVVQHFSRCSGREPDHMADSYVHRYHYEVGFLADDDAEERANAEIQAARRRTRQLGIGQIKSHDQRVTNFAIFERWVLERMPQHEWAQWLLQLEVRGEEPLHEDELNGLAQDKQKFMAPSKALVETYIDALRFGDIDLSSHSSFDNNLPIPDFKPLHKGGTVRV
jgi:hypothetical protein